MGLLDEQPILSDIQADMHDKTDEEILALSVREPEHFRILLERYQDAFLRKAISILKNKEDAEEVVQEVFSKIYRYADKFTVQEGASFSSWGYRILMNTSFTRYQRLKKDWGALQKLEPEMYESLPDTKMEQFEKFEMSDYVVSILSGLPDNLSRILNKHFIEGKQQKDIAEEEGISVGAVKTRVHRAKEAFRKEMNKENRTLLV
ncbi:RNA polymerase sigma factor [Candidatus Kaiserbacteria bacterium]|nr:RNA polymerase sigma factor [Candidatus Kaiserbacteria bacterium]